jgi:uncharacterized membrane protein YphA (DoxX/SURF4 family)
MPSVFPDLLTFALAAPLFLRVAVGVLFLISGWKHLSRERDSLISLLRERYPALATFSAWYIGIVEILLGVFYVVGLFTQIVAILGAITALKMLYIKKWKGGALAPLARYSGSTYLLIFFSPAQGSSPLIYRCSSMNITVRCSLKTRTSFYII